MVEDKIDRVYKRKNNFIYVIYLLIFILAGLFIYISFSNIFIKHNPMPFEDVVKNKKEKDYAYIDLIYISSFAKDKNAEDVYYYYVVDVNKRLFVAKMNNDEYQKILYDYERTHDDFHYILSGYTKKVSSSLKQSSIDNFDSLGLNNELTEENYKYYLLDYYLDTTYIQNNTIYYVFAGVGMIILIFGIFLLIMNKKAYTDLKLPNKELVMKDHYKLYDNDKVLLGKKYIIKDKIIIDRSKILSVGIDKKVLLIIDGNKYKIKFNNLDDLNIVFDELVNKKGVKKGI